jgi:hypothetical protein
MQRKIICMFVLFSTLSMSSAVIFTIAAILCYGLSVFLYCTLSPFRIAGDPVSFVVSLSNHTIHFDTLRANGENLTLQSTI